MDRYAPSHASHSPSFSTLLTPPLGTILGLLIPWLLQSRPRLASFDPDQTVAFISDLGAFQLKPLFIAGAIATSVLYVLTLLADRFLRHRRAPRTATIGEKLLTVLAIGGAAVGGAGLSLLSIFDDFNFKDTHDKLLVVFIGGNLISAAALVMEYMLVARHWHRTAAEERTARMSFGMKLVYFLLEIVATAAFAAERVANNINVAGVLEYVNAALFAWFIFSFVMDLRTSRGGYRPMPKEAGRPTGWAA